MSYNPEYPVTIENGRHPALSEPIKYHVDYHWGSLNVTEEADAAYGLVPLEPAVQYGVLDHDDHVPLRGPRTDIILMGPQPSADIEAEESPQNHGQSSIRLLVNTLMHDRGMDVALLFDKSSQELADDYKTQFAKLRDMEADEDFDECPSDEEIQGQITKLYAYTLARQTQQQIIELLPDHMTETQGRQFSRVINRTHLASLITSAALGVGGSMTAPETSTPMVAAAGAGYALMSTFLIRESSRYAAAAVGIHESNTVRAVEHATDVASDLFKTYCREVPVLRRIDEPEE